MAMGTSVVHDQSPSRNPRDSDMMFMVRFAFFLVLFVSIISSGRADDNILQCPAFGPCRKAFLTSNPMSLKCGNQTGDAPITWQFLDARDPYTEAVTFISSSGPVNIIEGLNQGQQMTISSLVSRAQLTSGDLTILSPRVEDTGLYICKDGEKTLASYEVDFQDANCLHIFHSSLMQNGQLNTIIDLDEEGTLEMFTVWSEWQPCDRCRSPGERKRIGYCYAEVSKDAVILTGPVPCGLLRTSFKEVLTRPPELQIKICQEACVAKLPKQANLILTIEITNYHTLLHADASFTCPGSSIYRPVYWMHEGESTTRLKQMLKTTTYIMDDTTGGGTLSIHMLNKTEQGTFECYVERQLKARFNIIFPNVITEPETNSWHQYILMGVGAFLIASVFIEIALACYKTTQRVIH